MTREDRDAWNGLDDDEQTEAYAEAIEERDRLRTDKAELLAVLREWVGRIDAADGECWLSDEGREFLGRARATIAKAEGKVP